MELCIWFTNGTTAYFTDVSVIDVDKNFNVLKFDYFGRSSNKYKQARFQISHIAGYSYSEEEQRCSLSDFSNSRIFTQRRREKLNNNLI